MKLSEVNSMTAEQILSIANHTEQISENVTAVFIDSTEADPDSYFMFIVDGRVWHTEMNGCSQFVTIG